jgi:aminomuconate-semialdehyde/2-hydroxymuconate-6-semialdehyde dehydrogenase
MQRIGNFVEGSERSASAGKTFDSVDPYTRRPWAQVALSDAADVGEAVAAARQAFDRGPWPRLSMTQRADVLRAVAANMLANKHRLAELDSRDVGKPITRLVDGEVPGAAAGFTHAAAFAETSHAELYPRDADHHVYTDYPPAGVVAVVSPWNLPLWLAVSRVAPALAWGNTVVLKPAEQSPASVTLLAQLAVEAGLPSGVLNVVHGYGPDSAGEHLVGSPDIDRVAFTGSTAAGKAIAGIAARNLVPVSLECGGKSATVIFDDADLDRAVPVAANAIFGNSGQVCFAGSRILVQAGAYDRFVERLCAFADSQRLGDPTDPATQLGPLASEEQFTRASAYLDLVPDDGGQLLTGGVAGDGWFVRPTVVAGLPFTSAVWREEVFAPVAAVTRFVDDDEAVTRANDSEYGLSASVFTSNLRRAHAAAGRLQAGVVWVNTWGALDRRAPFGGFKQSGVGRQGGRHGRDFLTEPRTVYMSLGYPARGDNSELCSEATLRRRPG